MMEAIPPFQPPQDGEQRDVAMALLHWYHNALLDTNRKVTASLQYQQAIYQMLAQAGFRTDGPPVRRGPAQAQQPQQRQQALGDLANIAGFVMQNPGTIEGIRKVVSAFFTGR